VARSLRNAGHIVSRASWPAFRRYIDSSRRGREQSRISCSLLQPNGLSSLLVVAVLILVPQPLPFLGAELMVLNLVGLWIFIRTYYTFFYKHRDNSHRGGMTTSRAIPFGGAFLLGIAGGIALIRGSLWGMYIVTVSYTTLLVTVLLGTWSIMLGIEQGHLSVEQREKAGS
jgi:hypothetical protein